MNLLHTSDWHLGAMDGDQSLLEDQRCFIDEICGIVRDRSVDAVLIAGDVYDRSVGSAEAIKLYDYAMTRLCGELKVPVLIIAGNHDGAERLSSCRELLASAGLHISGALEEKPSKVSLGDTDVYLLPWITEEKVKSIFRDRREEISSLEDAYRVVLEEIRRDFDPAKRHVLVAHAYLTNSETSTSDRAAEIGTAVHVPAGLFDGFDYVALGHLHGPQDVTKKIRYSGTPMPYSFGKEENQQKSVTILHTEDMTRTVVPLSPLHSRVTLEGTLEELLTGDYPDRVRNGYVRLKVTDQYVGLEALSELKKVFANPLEVSGRSFEGENTTVTLTMEELEELETNPVEVFRHFCREETDMEPDEHFIRMFEDAVRCAQEEKA